MAQDLHWFGRYVLRYVLRLMIIGYLPLCWIGAQASTAHTVNTLPMAEIRALATVYHDIRRYYVDPVDDKVIFKNAIRGMVSALDPHSDFIDGHAFEDLEESISGSFGGIGIEIREQASGVFVIAAVLAHTPAARAHLLAGDHIIKINNTLTTTMTLNELVKALRGPVHSLLRMTVLRAHHTAPMTIVLSRNTIAVDNVTVQWRDEHYLWIRINEFQENTLSQLINQLNTLPNNHILGLILDLRNNPGGLLSTAIDISSVFLPPQTLLVSTRNTHHPAQSHRYLAHDIAGIKPVLRPLLLKQAMIVLVNNGSASAAEIVAGALQDQHRAIIMGSRTFGKGTVQTTFPIKYLKNTIIKLTTARYYTPSGAAIQERGITPDIDLTGEQPLLPIYEDNLGRHLKNDQHPSIDSSQDHSIHIALPDNQSDANQTTDHHDPALQQAVQLLKTWSLFQAQTDPNLSVTNRFGTHLSPAGPVASVMLGQ